MISYRELGIKDLMPLDAFGLAWIRPRMSNRSRSVDSLARKTSKSPVIPYIGSSTTISNHLGASKGGSRTEDSGRGARAGDLGSAEDSRLLNGVTYHNESFTSGLRPQNLPLKRTRTMWRDVWGVFSCLMTAQSSSKRALGISLPLSEYINSPLAFLGPSRGGSSTWHHVHSLHHRILYRAEYECAE